MRLFSILSGIASAGAAAWATHDFVITHDAVSAGIAVFAGISSILVVITASMYTKKP